MFGYGHPNTFGGVMFGLLLAWVLLRRARLTWPELTGVAAVGVFLMVGPKSRSAALCTFLLVLLLALAKLRTPRGGCTRAADRWQRSARPRCQCWPRSVIFYRCSL